MRTNRFNTGKAFEHEIQTIATHYAGQRIMRLAKTDPPLRYAGGRIIHMPNPFTDFVGCWMERDGRAIFIEAKSTREPKLEYNKSHLSPKQLDQMHCWDTAGAVVFLLWGWRGDVRLWTVGMIEAQIKEWRHLKYENGELVPPGIGWVTHDFRVTMLKFWPLDNPADDT